MERPILFSTDMVQALLAGRKTQTRRMVKMYSNDEHPLRQNPNWLLDNKTCPYGQKGDLLWVRENFCFADSFEDGKEVRTYSYKASPLTKLKVKWKPSIHMPKDAARIWLKVTNVRVERLQQISPLDAISEGIQYLGTGYKGPEWRCYSNNEYSCLAPQTSFMSLWNSINGENSWAANPWVWVVEFEVISTTGRANVKEERA